MEGNEVEGSGLKQPPYRRPMGRAAEWPRDFRMDDRAGNEGEVGGSGWEEGGGEGVGDELVEGSAAAG